jgi:polyisoprenoid-binding protein YceI
VVATGADTFRIHGQLTLHGVTRPLVLDAKYNGGYASHPYEPNARAGFSAQGSFKRSEFGVNYGLPAPGTDFGVGDLVSVTLETEFTGPSKK